MIYIPKMPTNVTVEYALAEKAFREARTPEEKLRALERMYAEVPKHKGTENLRKEIKKKIAYWKKQIEQKRKKTTRKSFSIVKETYAVGIIGKTNVGKSLLMKKLTNANTIVASYEFSTKQPVVGMMPILDTKLQTIDFPPLFENVAFNDSLRQYFSPLRICDLLLIVTLDPSEFDDIKKELDNLKIILGKRKSVRIKRSHHLEIHGWQLIKGASYDDVVSVVKENGLHNSIIMIDEPMTMKEFVLALDESYYFVDYIVLQNHYDDIPEYVENGIYHSNFLKENEFKLLKELIWKKMNLIRIYTKDKMGNVSKEPIVLKKDSRIADLAIAIHKDFLKKFRYAKIWGKSAKFDGQVVGLDHALEDQDIIEFFTK